MSAPARAARDDSASALPSREVILLIQSSQQPPHHLRVICVQPQVRSIRKRYTFTEPSLGLRLEFSVKVLPSSPSQPQLAARQQSPANCCDVSRSRSQPQLALRSGLPQGAASQPATQLAIAPHVPYAPAASLPPFPLEEWSEKTTQEEASQTTAARTPPGSGVGVGVDSAGVGIGGGGGASASPAAPSDVGAHSRPHLLPCIIGIGAGSAAEKKHVPLGSRVVMINEREVSQLTPMRVWQMLLSPRQALTPVPSLTPPRWILGSGAAASRGAEAIVWPAPHLPRSRAAHPNR